MTRRKKLIAAALALPLALALGVGLTVRRAGSDPLSADVCDKDLAAVFEYCEAGGAICRSPFEGMEEACQAGCVMRTCPNHVACTELDPIWCKPCDDEQGAPYWRILHEAERLCAPSPNPAKWTPREQRDYVRCFKQEGTRMCPALAQKPYWETAPQSRATSWNQKRCFDDFDKVAERCERYEEECGLEPGADKKACQRACLLAQCPDQVACTGDDPVRCAPCEDPHGALYWRRVWATEGLCGSLHPLDAPNPEPDKWAACFVAEMERECRALAGTAWWRRAPFLVEHYGNARPSPASAASPAAP
ncbi:hypothetical protein [Polyangium fumosum]|uniref:Uncharacterized protein n=1 Tax=Polyangium fumosum TaxID=889272 RepID=A0A4U1JKC5_9BACT|nr:hypothetical protein [Polyangium fumosum]TKD13075.1 hypothetical protein E8A74_00520 [Polyangium fumosum]